MQIECCPAKLNMYTACPDQQPQDDITTTGIDASAAAEPSGEASCLEETTDGETLASLSQEIGDRGNIGTGCLYYVFSLGWEQSYG